MHQELKAAVNNTTHALRTYSLGVSATPAYLGQVGRRVAEIREPARCRLWHVRRRHLRSTTAAAATAHRVPLYGTARASTGLQMLVHFRFVVGGDQSPRQATCLYDICDPLAMHQDGFELARRLPKAEHQLNFMWFTNETKPRPEYIYSLNDENC